MVGRGWYLVLAGRFSRTGWRRRRASGFGPGGQAHRDPRERLRDIDEPVPSGRR